MSELRCKHCDGKVEATDSQCSNCGIPLPPHHANQRQRTFILWFVVLVIFCLIMIIWLPPDWRPL